MLGGKGRGGHNSTEGSVFRACRRALGALDVRGCVDGGLCVVAVVVGEAVGGGFDSGSVWG